jgi:translocation and assembly module TamA
VGVGFTTNTGPRGRLGFTNRRIDERGHQWGANLLLSNVVSELTANYRLPSGDPRSEWLSLDIGFKHEVTDTSTSDAYQMGIRRIKERSRGWREAQFVDFLFEDFVIGDQQDSSTLVIPGIAWQRVKTANRFRPDNGLRLFLEFRGSADALGSDTNFFRADAAAKWIRKVRARSRIILRGELGAILTDRFSELPPSIRFFVGGDASIRGYDFQSLGPTGPDGNVIGGTAKLVASAEYEFDVKQKWSVAAFVDSGNAFDNFDLQPRTGAGIGFRWQSPVGPVRVDVAKPFNGVDRGLRLHVTFGPDL